MYIIKNAFKGITRSLGRNLLIGIMVFVIATSACLGLSIMEAAKNAREEGLKNVSITAQITMDMKNMMQPDENGGFDRENFKDRVGNLQSLTEEELITYSKALSVSDFYYTLSASLNGNSIEPVSTDDSTKNEVAPPDNRQGYASQNENSNKVKPGMMFANSDFTVMGYSSENALSEFINGTAKLTEGALFPEYTAGTESYSCIIPTELATFNELSVGSTFTVENPNSEGEVYTFTVSGIYESSNNESSFGGMGGRGSFGATDPSNRIYTSASALQNIVSLSNDASESPITTTANGTYVFSSVEDYESFDTQARALGLSDDYTITSSDVNNYEQSLVPLDSLSTFAKYFLIVVLLIGGIILIVFNLFNIRERKYEVGVLTAIGMKKRKVAAQFICEVAAVTMIAVILGGIVGAATSVPVTNALLNSQTVSTENSENRIDTAFGRDNRQTPPDMEKDNNRGFGAMKNNTVEYIKEVNSATDINVLLKLLGIGIGLSIIASTVSVSYIMRYDPLKILANRD